MLLREVVRLHVIRRELLLLELLAHELLLMRLLRRGIQSGVGLHAPRAGNAVRLLVHQRSGLIRGRALALALALALLVLHGVRASVMLSPTLTRRAWSTP